MCRLPAKEGIIVTVPTVSVVMSVRNGGAFLREAVESILQQSFRDFEFVIIDDGSTDESGSVLDRYQKSDSRVQVFHQENRGLIESLNRGCRLSRGKYIARMDADDIALNDRLERQVKWMEEHQSLGALGGAVELISATGKSLGIYPHPCESREIALALADGDCAIWHPTAFIRKNVFLSVGGYRPIVVDAEDYDLWLRVADRFELANLEAVVLKYRVHSSQVSIRKHEQQTLSCFAARAAALSRKKGNPDPLESVSEITPRVLEDLGVSEATQGAGLARHWLTCIRSMYQIGEFAAARRAIEGSPSHYLKYAESWVIADLHLYEASLLWQQGRFAKSISKALQAFITRPVVLARPAKCALQWVPRVWRAKLVASGSGSKETWCAPEPKSL